VRESDSSVLGARNTAKDLSATPIQLRLGKLSIERRLCAYLLLESRFGGAAPVLFRLFANATVGDWAGVVTVVFLRAVFDGGVHFLVALYLTAT
jgi:hypothetical protein